MITQLQVVPKEYMYTLYLREAVEIEIGVKTHVLRGDKIYWASTYVDLSSKDGTNFQIPIDMIGFVQEKIP